LIAHGRIGQALHEKHYLHEQRARLGRARLELRRAWERLTEGGWTVNSRSSPGPSRRDTPTKLRSSGSPNREPLSELGALFGALAAVLNRGMSIRLVRMSESPIYVGRVVLLVSLAFSLVVYPFVGGVRTPGALLRGGRLLPPDALTAWRLFVFSLLTFFEGTYLVLKGTFGAFLPFEEFEPAGVSVTAIAGVEPVGHAVWVAWSERFLGALLVVPFALLIVQRLRLYLGGAVSEEGLGGGLLSWLLGR
jgi:hypothetical protein